MRITKPFRRLAAFVRGGFVAHAPGRHAPADDDGTGGTGMYDHAGYVSEFSAFMNRFLLEHPEEIEVQRRGWNIYWNHPADLQEQQKAAEDSVPTEGYYYGPPLPHKTSPSPSQGEGRDGGAAAGPTDAPPPRPSP